MKYRIFVPGHVHEPIGLDPQFGERTVNQAEVFAAGTNFWSPAVPVPIAEPSLAAAIGDLAGNVGFATNTILLNLTTNAAYAYDMAGNVTNISYNAGEETVGLIWNSQYELTAVHTNGALAESYRYDPLGRRVRTITGAVTNYHLYNGIHALADLDATGAVLRAYTYGPGIDNLLAMTTFSASETNHYYYLTDHLGSVLAITDEDGEIVERYQYDAWGRVTITDSVGLPLAESSIGNRFGFQGREHSWATGLIHFRARWCDPITGRWLSNDPIGISGGLNQYVAFENNPVEFIDPLGLAKFNPDDPASGLGISGGGVRGGSGAAYTPSRGAASRGSGKGVRSSATSTGATGRGWIGRTVDSIKARFKPIPPVHSGQSNQSVTSETQPAACDVARGTANVGPKVAKQMGPRGWTAETIDEAIKSGDQVRAINKATGNPATRYMHPRTGQSVVVDNLTGEVIHVGGPGFKYGPGSGDLP